MQTLLVCKKAFLRNLLTEGMSAKDKGGLHQMFKEFAWNAFIETGDLESYMFYREIEERDKAVEQTDQAEAEAATSAGNT